MIETTGFPQKDLRKRTCLWGQAVRRHAALIPFFRRDYRVIGLVGLSLKDEPLWYPGPPRGVSGGRLFFLDTDSAQPPTLLSQDPLEFEDAYFFDPWGVLAPLMAALAGTEGARPPANLARRHLLGHAILDVIYEPALHRVRAFRVRSGWFGTEDWSILRIPALREALGPGKPARGRTVPPGYGVAPENGPADTAEPGAESPDFPAEEPPGPGETAAPMAPSVARDEGFLARMVRQAIEAGMKERQE